MTLQLPHIHQPVHRLYAALNQWEMKHPNGDPSLWGVQNDALRQLRGVIPKATQKKQNAFYFHMFTGTGKTRLGAKIIELLHDFGNGEIPKTVIRVPTRFLVRQFRNEIAAALPHLTAHLGVYYSHEKSPLKQIVVTTFQSFRKGTAEGFFQPGEIELVITDESHEGLSERRVEDLEPFKKAVKIALTATPDYSSDRTVADHYELAYKLGHIEAIDQKVIAPFRNVLLLSDTSLDGISLNSDEGYDLHDLEKKVNQHGRNMAAIKFYKSYIEPTTGRPALGQQALAFCAGIDHAKDFAAQANESLQHFMQPGITFCQAVWGDMPELDKVLERFERGEILCLSNADLLVRGYNHPNISMCLNMAPSRSSVVVGQRGGRALRYDPNHPEKVALIIDIVDENTDPRNFSLLYGEYVGGAAFGTIFNEQPDTAKIPKPIKKSISTLVGPQTVLVTREEVMAYFSDRQDIRKESLRAGIIVDRVLPALRERMGANGLDRLYQLWIEIKDDLPTTHDELDINDRRPSYARFTRICQGITSAWNVRNGSPTLEAFAIANLLKCEVSELFGEPPAKLRMATKEKLPYNREQHVRFSDAMKAAGFVNAHGWPQITRLQNAILLNNHNISLLTSLSRGQTSPVLNSTGDFSPLAMEVATVLNMSPEELFDTHANTPIWTPDARTPVHLFDDEENLDYMEDDAEGDAEMPQSYRLKFCSVAEKAGGGYSVQVVSRDTETDRKRSIMGLSEDTDDILNSLTPREGKILRFRFGIDISNDHTFEEIAAKFRKTVAQVRKIQEEGIRKLKHPSRSDKLRSYADADDFGEATGDDRILVRDFNRIPIGSELEKQNFFEIWSILTKEHGSCFVTSQEAVEMLIEAADTVRNYTNIGHIYKRSDMPDVPRLLKMVHINIDGWYDVMMKERKLIGGSNLDNLDSTFLVPVLKAFTNLGIPPRPDFFDVWQSRVNDVWQFRVKPIGIWYKGLRDCIKIFNNLGVIEVDRHGKDVKSITRIPAQDVHGGLSLTDSFYSSFIEECQRYRILDPISISQQSASPKPTA